MTVAFAQPIPLLVDADSFRAVDDEGTVGWATVAGIRVLVFATDFSVYGGSTCVARAAAWLAALQQAEIDRVPLIGFYHGGGARLQEGGAAVAAYAQVLAHLADTRCMSLAILTGPCAGGDALAPQLADLCFTVGHGGVRLSQSGAQPKVAGHFGDLSAAVMAVRRGITFGRRQCVAADTGDDLVDPDSEMVLWPQHPRLSLARIAGITCAVVTVQNVFNGDGLSATARLIRLCDKNGWPVISRVCGTGFDPEANQALLARGAQEVMQALRAARCQKIALLTGHAFGASYALFGCKPFWDTVLALPLARVAAVTAEAAARLTKAIDPPIFVATYTQELLCASYTAAHHLADAIVAENQLRAHVSALLRIGDLA